MPSKYHAWKSPARRPDPAPYVSLIAHQPDDRPPVVLSAKSWITVPATVMATERVNDRMRYADRFAAISPALDADQGWGARRRKDPFAKEPAGYTARTQATVPSRKIGLSQAALDDLAGQRSWKR